ncbi:KH domain-containing protein akap-1-like [Labeo rohita]|uniref:KH domain-containing protein akap-1-like n=1 Tax=Labeo rohita TaxID=84645 RepID=UPI0021E302DD|nr:KH domain-containing protein akap-1-like [Labeo rohita]
MLRRNSSRSFAEMNHIPDIGLYVMVWFGKQEMWCRGQIIRICQMSRGPNSRDHTDIKVEVRRIDYGDVVCVSLWDVKELCGETASIPVQALQVSLVNVRPVNGETWSFEAISWFRSKVQSKILYARLYPEEGEVLVELFMEKGKIGAMRRGDSLSVRLAQNGFAIHECNKPSALKRSDIPEKNRQQSLQWEKYLISCYSQNKK